MAKVLPQADDYVLQHNDLSRAVYSMSVTARRLIALAMSRLRADNLSIHEPIVFSTREALQALGKDDGIRNYEQIRKAVQHVSLQQVWLETRIPGEEHIRVMPWFGLVEYDEKMNHIRLTFNHHLEPLLKEFVSAYERIEIKSFAKLKSFYAIRLFEILMSFRGHRANGGNRPGEWFVEYTPEELKRLFGIEPGQWVEMKNFRPRVVEKSVQEINDAGLGVWVEVSHHHRGRKVAKFRFDCSDTATPLPNTLVDELEDDPDDALLNANPEAWEDAQRDAVLELGANAGSMKLQARAWELFTARSDLSRPRPRRRRGRPKKAAKE